MPSKYEDDRWDMPEGYYLPDELEERKGCPLLMLAIVVALVIVGFVAGA